MIFHRGRPMTQWYRLALIFTLTVANSSLYGQKEPIAILLDLISKNDAAPNIVQTLSDIGPLFLALKSKLGYIQATWLMTQLTYYKPNIQTFAEKIAKETKGTGNITKKLIAKIRSDLLIDLPDEAHKPLTEMGTVPVLYPENVKCIKKIKQHSLLIGIGTQDPLGYEVYKEKMLTNHNINLGTLIDQIVLIPSLDDSSDTLKDPGYYQHKQGWYIAAEPYPSAYCKTAIMAALGNSGYSEKALSIIDTSKKLQRLASGLS